jgi:hypothetical protein
MGGKVSLRKRRGAIFSLNFFTPTPAEGLKDPITCLISNPGVKIIVPKAREKADFTTLILMSHQLLTVFRGEAFFPRAHTLFHITFYSNDARISYFAILFPIIQGI